jgi:hypothetical protein
MFLIEGASLMRGIKIAAVLLGISVVAYSVADETSMASAFRQFLAAPDNPIILRGDYLKAILLANEAFAKSLSRHAIAANSGTSSQMELAARLSKLENYDVSVDLTPSSYIVQFGPTVRDQAHVVFGGGFRYAIDRKTFVITEKVGLK